MHSDCISKYRIAFHMLWRLKRVEWSLATTWKQHTLFNHAHRAHIPPTLRAVFHRCYLNRAMMMHVVNNLCAFLMFEVLETSWLNLQVRFSCLLFFCLLCEFFLRNLVSSDCYLMLQSVIIRRTCNFQVILSLFLFSFSFSLQETIGRARCVDDVITAHDAYLSEVLDRALLAPHHEELNLQIQQLLHIVLRFCNLEETLIAGKEKRV